MKLVADPDVAAWLSRHPTIEWDHGNSTKSQTKHRFTMADVASLLDAPMLFAGRILELAHEKARYLLLGVTASGRRAALIFAWRGEQPGPIRCRAMRKKEKEAYDGATQVRPPQRV